MQSIIIIIIIIIKTLLIKRLPPKSLSAITSNLVLVRVSPYGDELLCILVDLRSHVIVVNYHEILFEAPSVQ